MNETTVTVVGTVCSEVRYSQATDETPMARFQIRNTPRRYDKRTGTWGDGDPSYYSAICFRALADHVASSMGVGDPVVATGRLRISRWRRGEEHMTTAELDVQAIGHDLRWGTTVYRRANPPTRVPGPGRHRHETMAAMAGTAGSSASSVEGDRTEGETETETAVLEPGVLEPVGAAAAGAGSRVGGAATAATRADSAASGAAADRSPAIAAASAGNASTRAAAAKPMDNGASTLGSTAAPTKPEALRLPLAA